MVLFQNGIGTPDMIAQMRSDLESFNACSQFCRTLERWEMAIVLVETA